MKVVSIALILLLNAIPVFSQKADYSKLSPSLRRMAIGQARNVSKAKELNEGKGSGKCVVAFVRCGDTDVLEREGCRVLESLDDIHIARIPLSPAGDKKDRGRQSMQSHNGYYRIRSQGRQGT